ncbi:MAG: uracil-DNA glycosylase [Rubrivivax sp.]|nr:uracil-DNA glycosylase [Rubrivivax sp.]
MVWSERQHALLRGIGIRVWSQPWQAAASEPAHAAALSPAQAYAPSQLDDGPLPAALGVAEPTPPRRSPAPRAQRPSALPPVLLSARSSERPSAVNTAVDPAVHTAGKTAVDTAAIARGLDWPALQDAVARCTACALCSSRTQTVFGAGHTQAQWLVVGEAPGEQEDRQGEPFVGPAGQLLDRMLAALQLTRAVDCDTPAAQRVYIANTLKCRPPRNRNPSADELAACESYLVRQIELLQPRVILAMGRFAVQSLLRSDEPVGRLRGRVHRYQGVPLIVTYHPAYLLRNLPDKAKAWEDLCLAAQVMNAPPDQPMTAPA